MKATGIVRRIDELGRIVIPKELRKTMHLNEHDQMEIYVNDDKIMLKKHNPACIITGSAEELIEYCGRKISKQAIIEMSKLI